MQWLRRRWPRLRSIWLKDSRSVVLALGERRYRFVLPRLGR
jgi:hypothetical protein